MPARLEACFFIEEPPEITYERGMFHVVTMVGDYRFERVMQPSTFFETIRVAVEASRQHRSVHKVVPIRGVTDDHAASDRGNAAK